MFVLFHRANLKFKGLKFQFLEIAIKKEYNVKQVVFLFRKQLQGSLFKSVLKEQGFEIDKVDK